MKNANPFDSPLKIEEPGHWSQATSRAIIAAGCFLFCAAWPVWGYAINEEPFWGDFRWDHAIVVVGGGGVGLATMLAWMGILLSGVWTRRIHPAACLLLVPAGLACLMYFEALDEYLGDRKSTSPAVELEQGREAAENYNFAARDTG